MANVIEEARLICVNIKKGNNKLYWMDLYDDGKVRVRYGRYIEEADGTITFQHDDMMDGGRTFFERKKHEKLRAKKGDKEPYVEQPTVKGVETGKSLETQSLKSLALSQIRTKGDEEKKIVEWWCDSNIHNITSNTKIQYNDKTGLFTTSFGLITSDGINEARQQLSNIRACMDKNSTGADFENAIDAYLRIIPRNLGRSKAAYSQVFPSVESVQSQNTILDSLESSLVTATTIKPDGSQQEVEQLFDCSLELVTDTNEFDRIVKYYKSTSRDMHAFAHGWQISKIYKLDHVPMREAYERDGKILGEHKELWHGTGYQNIVSILRKPGFQITPPASAAIAGKAFGYGIYLAIHSTKSMGYATGYHAGGSGGSKAFMFLCDTALGKYYVPRSSTTEPPPKGYHTYWAKPNETRKFSGYMENDEIVIFNSAQMNPTYLVELSK